MPHTDEEVREILPREEPEWYESMRPEAIAALEPEGPVVNIDADVETLNAIVGESGTLTSLIWRRVSGTEASRIPVGLPDFKSS